jgi:hypothetical protein
MPEATVKLQERVKIPKANKNTAKIAMNKISIISILIAIY